MRRLGLGFVLLAASVVGCGESGPSEGSVEFKSGNVDQIGPVTNQMMENMKNKAYLKSASAEEKAKAAGAAKAASEATKPASK